MPGKTGIANVSLVVRDEDVARLDIEMNESRVVRSMERISRLRDEIHGPPSVEVSFTAEERPQV